MPEIPGAVDTTIALSETYHPTTLSTGGELIIIPQQHTNKNEGTVYPKETIDEIVKTQKPTMLLLENTRPFGYALTDSLYPAQSFHPDVQNQLKLAKEQNIPVALADITGIVFRENTTLGALIDNTEQSDADHYNQVRLLTLLGGGAMAVAAAAETIAYLLTQDPIKRRFFLAAASGSAVLTAATSMFPLGASGIIDAAIYHLVTSPHSTATDAVDRGINDLYVRLTHILNGEDDENGKELDLILRSAKYLTAAELLDKYEQETEQKKGKIGLIVGLRHQDGLTNWEELKNPKTRFALMRKAIRNKVLPVYSELIRQFQGDKTIIDHIQKTTAINLVDLATTSLCDVTGDDVSNSKGLTPRGYFVSDEIDTLLRDELRSDSHYSELGNLYKQAMNEIQQKRLN